MPKAPLLCIEMELAPDQQDEALRRAVEANSRNVASSSGAYTRYWRPGARVRVRFLDGGPTLQRRVASIAAEWSRYANVEFSFGDAGDAEIRITFATPALWSYVGTDALLVPGDQPTMCLGALSPLAGARGARIYVLHAFGHALGWTHEHQNPAADLPWDKRKVYAYFAGPPYFWTAEQVDHHLFDKYRASLTQFREFDPRSIMLAAIPAAFTTAAFEVGWNPDLSDTDKQFAGRTYPYLRSAKPPAPQTEAPLPKTVDVGDETDHSEAFDLALPGSGVAQGLEEEHIRLDVAHPSQVVVDEPFDLAVAVRQPDAPVVAIDDLPEVLSEEGTVFRPTGEAVIKYRIEVQGANCTVEPSHYVILLRKGDNSPPRYFQVTAHKPGRQTIIVNAYQEDEAVAAQTRVRIKVQLPVGAPTRANVVELSSGTQEDPLRGLKGQLIDELSKLEVTDAPHGRTSLLDGIPGADTLNRDANNKRLDLDLIVTQLARRGRTASGEMAVAKLIDNALPYASGFEGEEKLRAIQQQLAEHRD